MESKEVKTESKSLHTKGKWIVGEIYPENIYLNQLKGARALIVCNDGYTSTHDDLDYNVSEDEAIANAAHIVKCVNAHDELVKALQGVSSLLDFCINATPTGAVRDLMCDANIIAQDALKKAND